MAGDQKNSGSENAVGWAILACVFFALLMLFWHFFQFEIKSMFRWIRWSEMWLVSQFVSDDYMVRWQGYDISFKEWFDGAPAIHPTRLDGRTLVILSVVVMSPFKLIFTVILGIMGMWAIMYGPGTQFRRKLGLDGLMLAQSKTFPVIAPFVKFDPSKQPQRPPGAPVPVKLPLFAEALSPEEWIAHNRIPIANGKVDEQAAYIAFSKQLGPRWKGAKDLPPYKQILLAAFCLKAARKRKESDEMMGRIALCWSEEKGLSLGKDRKLLSDARKVLSDKKLSEKTLAKCNQHAFQTTALLRALLTAREEGGVLAPAQFVWLRGHDRALWYPLNNLGRHAFHMEALGAISHFKTERMTQRPIPRPKVDDAIKAITAYMNSSSARAIPPLEEKAAAPAKKGRKK